MKWDGGISYDTTVGVDDSDGQRELRRFVNRIAEHSWAILSEGTRTTLVSKGLTDRATRNWDDYVEQPAWRPKPLECQK